MTESQFFDSELFVFNFVEFSEGLNSYPKCIEESIPLEEIAVLLPYNNNCKELALKRMENNIPYYISKHTFERTDFVKWLKTCSIWINNKVETSFDDIFQYWENLVINYPHHFCIL